MIDENDVRDKANEELLSIWANQNDYVPKVISWVKAEIERRQLDTSSIHVRTTEEIKDEEERESDRNFVMMVSLIQGIAGAFLLVFTIPVIIEQLSENLVGQTGEPDIGIPIVMLLLGLLMIVYAVGVWRERRWAILSGLVVYSLITVWNIVATAINGLMFFKGNDATGRVKPFVFSIGCTFISAGLALAFNRLRKKKDLTVR